MSIDILRPKRGIRAFAMGWLACVLMLAWPMAWADTPDDEALTDANYRLGKGFRIPDTGWTLGGYATGSQEHLHDRPPLTALDNLSLFVWWEGNSRWKLFSELDYENVLASRAPDHDGEHHYLALERLYADYALTDSSSIRAGKFLTPIGRWNLIHATPLVWSTSRPMVTRHVFPTNATGLMYSGSVPLAGEGLEYAIYGSNGADLRANPEIDTFKKAIGVHVSAPLLPGSRLGLSFASFEQEQRRGEHKQLAGFDFLWSRNDYEVSAEGLYRYSNEGPKWDEKGAFVQLVAPLGGNVFAFGRIEIFRQAGINGASQLWVAGLNYRYTPAVVFKVEWIGGKNNDIDAPEGFLSSVSVLF